MAEGTSSYKWESLKAMPTKRVYVSSVIANKTIFLIGGCDQTGTPLNNVESYDIEKKKWRRLAPIPTARAGICSAVIDNTVYCFGGVSTSQTPMNNVEKYDIGEKKWTELTPLSDAMMGMSSITRGRKIYLMGGMDTSTNPKESFICFDEEASPQWQKYPNMPTARYATSSFLINDKLYVVGGRQGKVPVTNLEVFDFEDEKWRKLPDIPSKRVFPCYTASDSHIFSLGGLNTNPRQGFCGTCETYDIEKEEWTTGTPMSQVRGDFAATVIKNKVVVTGGLANEGKPITTTELYDVSSNNWTTITPIPSAHCSCTSLTIDDVFYVIGGLGLQGPSGIIEMLRIEK